MDKKIFTTMVRTNLDGVLQMTQTVNGIMMTGDNAANQIIVELYNGSEKVSLTEETKIIGYFIRSDGYTAEVDGSIEDGNALVIIPEVAYQISGNLSIAIRLFEDPHEVVDGETRYITWGTKIVIAALSCYIQVTETDSIIDVYHHIPDVQELLQYLDTIRRTESLISEAEGLRVIAEQDRVLAESQRQENYEEFIDDAEAAEEQRQADYEQFIDDAEAAEEQRQTNYEQFIDDIETAETQRQTNESTRVSNETNRETAETARETAEVARETAQAARNAEIDNMTIDAVALAPYSPPTATITEVSGHKHILLGLTPGDPFVIAKTFASIAEMEAYTGTDIRVGQFVVIASNEEDPDNAKMFVKTSNSWSFITDLSGAQGIQGPRGFTGNGISSAVLNPDYTLTIYYTDGDSYTTQESIRGVKGETGNGIALIEENEDSSFTITMTDGTVYNTNPMKGEQGDTGNGIASIVRNADFTLTITMTNGSTYTTDPIKGEPGAAGTEFNYNPELMSLTITYF